MRDLDKDTLVKLAKKLHKLDEKIKESKGIDKDTKAAFEKLASMLERALEDDSPVLSRNIDNIMIRLAAKLEPDYPKIAKKLNKALKLCKALGI